MKKILIIVIIIFAAALLFKNGAVSFFKQATAQQSGGANKKDKNNGELDALPGVKVVEKWELPDPLLEVSGIAYLDANRFACVQDEKGVIFIFNKKTGKIEKEIPFAGAGDFEGLTLNGNTAWAVRSDGVLYEVNLTSAKSNSYKTYLTAANNIEGLCFDAVNNRLLLAGKDGDEAYTGYKCVYAFDLSSKQLLKEPAFKIDLKDPVLAGTGKKKSKSFMPSAIGIHPGNKDIFITDGPSSKLLQLTKKGELKTIYHLGKDFYQPEGISFGPGGSMYISNEGNKNPGNILEVELQN